MTNRDSSSEILKIYGRLLSYARPYIGIFLISTLGWTLHSAMQVGAADIFAYVVDVAKMIISPAEGDLERLAEGGIVARYSVIWLGQDAITHGRIIIPLVLFVLAIVRGLGFLVGNYGMTYVGRSLVYDLRTGLFNRLVRLPSTYYDTNMSGHLVAHLTYHVEQVTEASTNAVKTVIRDGLQVIGLLAYMLYTNWRLAAIFLVVFPFIGWIVINISRRFRRISGRIQESMGDVTQVSQEMVGGYREVRIFGGEEYERDRMRRASRTNLRQGLKLALVEGVSSPAVQILLAIALGGLIWISLGPKVIGSMSSGQLVAFLAASGLLAKPMRALTGVNSSIQRGLTAAQSIFTLLDTAEERDEGSVVKDTVRGQIDFRNVCFSYVKGGKPAVEDVSFHVEPGEVVALVGESGSGKTTLINLIPRFYNHCEGQILLDEVDVNDYQLANLRRHISLVTQNVTLFNDTVYHNLAYGELAGATPKAVREAARQAYALDFIEALPDGFNTLIGDDGLLLSGGQRQRLAIARALLKNAPLLILDEATSALDNESERNIQAALDEVMKGRTTLIIAHRLSTIEKADRILVMQKGRLVEQGTHHELLELDGRYAQLYKKQFSENSGSP